MKIHTARNQKSSNFNSAQQTRTAKDLLNDPNWGWETGQNRTRFKTAERLKLERENIGGHHGELVCKVADQQQALGVPRPRENR